MRWPGSELAAAAHVSPALLGRGGTAPCGAAPPPEASAPGCFFGESAQGTETRGRSSRSKAGSVVASQPGKGRSVGAFQVPKHSPLRRPSPRSSHRRESQQGSPPWFVADLLLRLAADHPTPPSPADCIGGGVDPSRPKGTQRSAPRTLEPGAPSHTGHRAGGRWWGELHQGPGCDLWAKVRRRTHAHSPPLELC